LHENVLVITKDPRKAARLAPIDGKPAQSDATREAIGFFGTLMTGVPFPVSQSPLIDQIDALIPLFAGKITMITKRDNMATPDEAAGLQNVGTYIEKAIQMLGEDKQQKERVTEYGKTLGKLMNEVKALIQRGAESRKKQSQQNGNGSNGEVVAKVQSVQALTKAKADALKAKTAQDMHMKELKFKQEQKLKDAKAFTDIEHQKVKTLAEAHNHRMKAFSSPEPENQ
jgi:hypothetical protein